MRFVLLFSLAALFYLFVLHEKKGIAEGGGGHVCFLSFSVNVPDHCST